MNNTTLNKKILQHSGEYVEKYDRKSIDRVAALTKLMDILPNASIGDFGCGNGMLLETLNDNYTEYKGIDFSNDFIMSAQKRAENIKAKNYQFHCEDIISFCSAHINYFDIACTLDFSEHIDDAEFIKIYGAIRSSLKKNGRLYIHTPNLDFFVEKLKHYGIMKQFPEHIAVRNIHAYIELLTEAGFKEHNIKYKIIPHYNILKYFHPIHKLPFIGHLFSARLWIEVSY